MSVYSKPGKGWRYDFTLKGQRHTEAWFKTKAEARRAEALKREEVLNPQTITMQTEEGFLPENPTGMGFLALVNRRLDHVKVYNSESHYRDILGHAKRWVSEWGSLNAEQISKVMIVQYLQKRAQVSNLVANKELQYIRALFNFALKNDLVSWNPTRGIDFLPVVKRRRKIPPKEHIVRVLAVADPESQDYLWTIILTAARVNEVNELVWEDVDFESRYVTLWTRKKKGGNREPRQIPMTQKLFEILARRYQTRHPKRPWVFWHTYWSQAEGRKVSGPYLDRKKLMKTLCSKASVPYFRFHPFRHFTASLLDDMGVPIGVIQRILGHENRKTTEIYLHSVGESERKAMQKLDSLSMINQAPARQSLGPTNMHKEFWHRKVERPSRNVLVRDVANLGYVGTGKKYGVSDNAIRKWMKADEPGKASAPLLEEPV